jgi:hypothetical protein
MATAEPLKTVKLTLDAGQARVDKVGQALGPHGVNIVAFVQAYNEATQHQRGLKVPVEVTTTPVPAPVLAAVDAVAESPAEQPAQGRDDGGMEMFGVNPTLVRLLFAHCGSTVVAAVPDDMAGSEWESYTYVIRREATI